MDLATYLEVFGDEIVLVYDENDNLVFPNYTASLKYIQALISVGNNLFFDSINQKYYEKKSICHTQDKHTYTFIRFTDISSSIGEIKNLEIDHTTGIFIKGKFLKEYQNFLRNNLITPESFALVLADIDHFKRVNDMYGHQAGDEVLNKISLMIRDEITYGESQKNNLIGRYGGEEILFLLRNVTSNQAIKKVESIRNMIAHFPVQYYDNSDFTCHDIHVTCSFGVLHVPGCKVSNLQKTGDIHDIMQKTITLADKEVYRAKEDGRNNAKLKLY